MSEINESKVYITRCSFWCLSDIKELSDVDNLLAKFDEIYKDFRRSKNIKIECSSDLTDKVVNLTSIQDDLLQLANDDYSVFSYYLSLFDKCFSEYVLYNNSETIDYIINNQKSSDYMRKYVLVIDRDIHFFTNVNAENYTSSWSETLNLNSSYIIKSKGDDEFVEWSKCNYEYLTFHPEILKTIRTIKIGCLNDYKEIISHALNSLNQSYFIISEDPNKNEEDLTVISSLTGSIGRTLPCSRQGKNKVEFEFPNKGIINCEYHLKINVNDKNIAIPHGKGNPIRIYFGLKSYNNENKKKIMVAHIGKHL
ncbi:hypothetical protein PMAL9190_00099 [Photobacterium malacitanum]|uniref:Uncharacterized protein n=1 Tax=Photobacterium malacitanum TaxID=2204294 RepID=A0A1Y6M4R6_9GAMM|nr:hypothetical protein [Photobacterium malacitanum]SMY31597.1 hypothetical protein PMAL9190_00099 [Photobacterium malacitanum]